MIERNKYLTEAMDECWHGHRDYNKPKFQCRKCGQHINRSWHPQQNDFSTLPGFGKLLDFMKRQDYWIEFVDEHPGLFLGYTFWFTDPDRFSNAVYSFLKGREV